MQIADENVPGHEAPLLRAIDRLFGRIENGFALFAAWFIFFLMLLGVVQILGRQLFNRPVPGYIDFVELSISAFAFLAVAYCQRQGGHVRMELVLNLTRGRLLWILETLSILASIFLVSVLIWFSWTHFERAWTSGDSTIDIELPVWPSKLAVPLAFSLLLVRFLIQLAGYLRLVVHPDAEPVGIPRRLSVEDLARKEISDSEVGR